MAKLTCPGCGGKAKFASGEALGWYKHKSGCPYDLEAKIMKSVSVKKKPSGDDQFPDHIQLPSGSLLWVRKESGVKGYSSEGDDFDILMGNGYVVLVSFKHDSIPGDDAEFWRKRFKTVREAMEYAERM